MELNDRILPRTLPPEKFYHVSQTQMSVARFYGGIKVNGHEYVYDPTEDSLTLVKPKQKKPRKKKGES